MDLPRSDDRLYVRLVSDNEEFSGSSPISEGIQPPILWARGFFLLSVLYTFVDPSRWKRRNAIVCNDVVDACMVHWNGRLVTQAAIAIGGHQALL